MRRSVGLHDLTATLKLHRLLGKARFDIVHSHSSKAGAIARLTGIGGKGAQVYSPHGFVTMADNATTTYGPVERMLSHLCNKIIAVSAKERQHAISLGIAPDKVIVVANGISKNLIASEPATKKPDQPFTVGFVGRLCDQKDPLLALDAFAGLCRAHPDSRLVMIGGGELE